MCHMSHQIALDEDTETSPPPVLLSGASVDKRVGETQNNSFFFFFFHRVGQSLSLSNVR